MQRNIGYVSLGVATVVSSYFGYTTYQFNYAQEACVTAVIEDHRDDYEQYRPCMVAKGYDLETLDKLLNRQNEQSARIQKIKDANIKLQLQDEEKSAKLAEIREQNFQKRMKQARETEFGFDFSTPFKTVVALALEDFMKDSSVYKAGTTSSNENYLAYIYLKWRQPDIRRVMDKYWHPDSGPLCLAEINLSWRTLLKRIIAAYPQLAGEANADLEIARKDVEKSIGKRDC